MTHAPHLAHGLAGDQLEPDWPALRRDELAAIVERLPSLGTLRSLDWRSPRPLSAAALVTTDRGRYFVKRHHRSVRDEHTLAEEHRFARHLRESDIPVPRTVRAGDGTSVLSAGDWVYEVHEAARGLDVYRDAYSWSPIDGEHHARAAGAMLARLHDAARGYAAPQRETHILVARAEILAAAEPARVIDAQLPSRPALARYLRERDWRAELADAIAPWHARAIRGIAMQARLWTHGDWHVSNLCWSGAGDDASITDVLDLGLSAETFALFDLATAIERNAIAWLDVDRGDIGRADLARALVDGYRSVRPLAAGDLALLVDLLPLVHIDFALSEVEYFEGITGRRDHADVAYHTFLLGHARWFATGHGRTFLDRIVVQ
ncbi:phosphotransferase [Luteibacter sp. 329MFSha]|uniref:phosphotransferase enzyme family protein n=1 Tax=Luteibacter sp. 329MFSha TaxID=1798239 RepID=UPI0008C21914|nr:phosphotransferase [Luteibacter sp. 329MFSha]SEW19896.1 Ser/Thr protein kinase RdoA involved in Cpx stress response, MazF antagonist [Luteibacter sp. 329MFSha]